MSKKIILAFGVGFLWQKVASLEKIVNPKVVGGQPTVAPTDPTGKLSKEDADRLPGVKDSDHILGNNLEEMMHFGNL